MIKISVIIPVKPGRKIEEVIKALRQVNYPPELIEVFVSYGFNPSKQRNQAARKAKGEILYFLDNDSEIEREAFKRAAVAFSGQSTSSSNQNFQTRGFSLLPKFICDLIIQRFFSRKIYKGEIGVVGGPNVWDRSEAFWSSMAGVVLESFFIHSLMAARYRPIGSIHRATEKELILCNLAVRRDVFKKTGGFNEILYPNEENELLNRIEKTGYQLIYHPGVWVFRRRRETLRDLLTAFLHYGRGRMEQIRIEGPWRSLPPLASLVFLGYLLWLGVYFSTTNDSYRSLLVFLPIIIYFVAAFSSSLGFAARRKKAHLATFLPFLFLTVHMAYASGLLWGLITDLEKRKSGKRGRKIKVIKIKDFDISWEKSQQ